MSEVKPPPGSRAILVGVSAYESDEYLPIPAARNSLEAMRDLLTDPSLCGWAPEQVTVISNPLRADDLAVQIANIARQTSGALLVYFVGHGTLTDFGELCLTVTTTLPDHPLYTGLTWDGLSKELRSSPARTRIAILDCCFAGQAIEALAGDDGAVLADLAHVQGVYTLTATTKNKTAHVPPLDQQANACTSFTAQLREVLTTGIPGRPDVLTFAEIYPVLWHSLYAKGLPLPNQRGTDSAGMFPIASNRSARPSTAPTHHTVDVGPHEVDAVSDEPDEAISRDAKGGSPDVIPNAASGEVIFEHQSERLHLNSLENEDPPQSQTQSPELPVVTAPIRYPSRIAAASEESDSTDGTSDTVTTDPLPDPTEKSSGDPDGESWDSAERSGTDQSTWEDSPRREAPIEYGNAEQPSAYMWVLFVIGLPVLVAIFVLAQAGN